MFTGRIAWLVVLLSLKPWGRDQVRLRITLKLKGVDLGTESVKPDQSLHQVGIQRLASRHLEGQDQLEEGKLKL